MLVEGENQTRGAEILSVLSFWINTCSIVKVSHTSKVATKFCSRPTRCEGTPENAFRLLRCCLAVGAVQVLHSRDGSQKHWELCDERLCAVQILQ